MYGTLACPRCGALVYAQRLNEIAAHAQAAEVVNPIEAAQIWQQALPLLPQDSQQYQMVAQRIGQLASGLRPLDYESAAPPPQAAIRPPDPWRVAVAKTAGSMIVSIIVYAWLFSGRFGTTFGAQFATGFVILILIHELGHSIAMRYFGLSASPPIFIPFLGAVINLRQSPRNALEEAVVGIGGPVLGTLGAGVAYMIYLRTNSPLFLLLSEFGFFLNLINLLPVPPLDGGRVTAAVSPWLWMPGILAVAASVVYGFIVGETNFILILLLLMAWPRVKATLLGHQHRGPYYQIGIKAKWAMGAAYVVLGLMLVLMFMLCRYEALRTLGPSWL
jgi:Zn-dependent protease